MRKWIILLASALLLPALVFFADVWFQTIPVVSTNPTGYRDAETSDAAILFVPIASSELTQDRENRFPEPDCPVPAAAPAANQAASDFAEASAQTEASTASYEEASCPTFPSDTECTPLQLLQKWLESEGLSETAPELNVCGQLLLTVAQPGEERRTVVCCYQRDSAGQWQPVSGLTELYGTLGKNGLAHDRRRNTETSPAGLWALGFAFGNSPKPEGMAWPWRDVTPNTDWVCDENSSYFNTWQERGAPGLEPWSDDVEHLEDYPTQYAYACVIEYNTPPGPVIPDRGCAIFLHCSRGPTGGCIGLPEADMIRVLQWLDPALHPHILITGES